jgi:hypothetical protein
MRADGSQPTNITNNPAQDDTFPDWGANDWIVFSRYGELRVVRPDGSDAARLPNSPGTDHFPDWLPAGAHHP